MKSKTKWLSTEEVKKEAKKGWVAALKCSIKHHRQILASTEEEFSEALRVENADVSIGEAFCALCQRKLVLQHYSCSICPLAEMTENDEGPYADWGRTCCEEWRRLHETTKLWLRKEGEFKPIKLTEKKLIKKLESIMPKCKELDKGSKNGL